MKQMLQRWLDVKNAHYYQGAISQLLVMGQNLDGRMSLLERWVQNLDQAVGRIEAATATGDIAKVEEAVQEMRDTTADLLEEIQAQKTKLPMPARA